MKGEIHACCVCSSPFLASYAVSINGSLCIGLLVSLKLRFLLSRISTGKQFSLALSIHCEDLETKLKEDGAGVAAQN